MEKECALLVFIKYPEEGKVKTRLAQTIGAKKAMDWYRVFVEYSLERYDRIESADSIVYFDPPDAREDFHEWLDDTFIFKPQPSGDLGGRLKGGFDDLLSKYRKVIALGTDSPDLPLDYITEAISELDQNEVVIGPTEDGGYYLIGLSHMIPDLFENIPWSTSDVFPSTVEILNEKKINFHQLPKWYDVDTEQDLKRFLLHWNTDFKKKSQT